MNWWEKEAQYETMYNDGRQAKNLWKYIPNKLSDAIDSTSVDYDGYWIYLNEGWTSADGGEDCGIIHCYNLQDLKADIKTIRRKV